MATNKSINNATAYGSVGNDRAHDAQNNFLVIGDMPHKLASRSSSATPNRHAVTFQEAKTILIEKAANWVPTMVIINKPLNYDNLSAFVTWLKDKYKAAVPVVYSETALNENEIKGLRRLNLVNDVVNLEKHYSKLGDKARFLREVMIASQDSGGKNSHRAEFAPCIMLYCKRASDIILASIAILLVLPLLALIALVIRLESKGPVLYSAPRAGKGFKVFKFFKFRTMVVDADKQVEELAGLNLYKNSDDSPAFFKIKNDPRITKVGSFLRNTSLDELPQLFNVLKGDMSIVGNRPLPLNEAAALTTDKCAERFMAPAGITGLWQVSKRGKEDMSADERIELDITYARNHGFKNDIKIMLKTPGALIQKTNV